MDAACVPTYAELHCSSNFSLGVGASSPEELVERAHAQGYSALDLTPLLGGLTTQSREFH